MKKIHISRCPFLSVFLLITASIAFGRGIVEQGSGRLVTKDYAIRDFDGIDVSGSWNVKISQGAYRVSVEVDDNILDYIRVEKRGSILTLSTKGIQVLNGTFNAVLAMPRLEKINSSGSSQVAFSGFELPELTIGSSGSSHIEGMESTIGTLDLNSSGSGEYDLRGCSVTDARIKLSGSTDVTLTMTGGELTGRMSGSGSVTYYGEIRTLSVNTSGSAKIMKK